MPAKCIFFLTLYARVSGKYITLDSNPTEVADDLMNLKAYMFSIGGRQYALMTSGEKKSIKNHVLVAGTGAMISYACLVLQKNL